VLNPLICLAAQGIVRDAETNNISAFSILEQLNPAGFPAFVATMGFLVIWRKAEGDPEQYDGEFRIHNNATELLRQPIRIDFEGSPSHRSIVGMGGLVLQEPGTLRFSIWVGGNELAHYEVKVTNPPARANVG